METFFKRYFWTLILLLLAAVAYLLGSAFSSVVGTLLIPGPGKITVVRPASQKDRKLTRSRYVEARNLFNSAATAEEMPSEGDEGDEAGLNPDDVPESNLNLHLVGTIYSPDQRWSFAVIQDGSEKRFFRVGQEIKADATLVAVWAEEAWVRRGDGKIESIKEREEGSSASRSYGSKTSASSSKAKTSSKAKDKGSKLREGIRRKSSTEYEIDRGMLEEQLADLNKLGTQARIIPHYKDGKSSGFKLVGVRPGSLYSHIGIRSGDVVRAINGMEMDSPTKALQIYEKLKTSAEISVDFERRGQKRSINYKIK